MRVGKQMQFFGARVNAAKALLYAINGGRDEMSGKLIVPDHQGVEGDGPLDFNDIWEKYEQMLDWVVGTYVEALNIIHYCHDRYAYEAIEMASARQGNRAHHGLRYRWPVHCGRLPVRH